MHKPLMGLALAAALLGAPGLAAQDETVALAEAASNLDLLYGGKHMTGGKVDRQLRAPVRHALNEWAAFAAKHGFQVLVPQQADALVLGHASEETLVEVAGCIDRTAELFAGLCAAAPADAPPAHAIVVALLDEEGFSSSAWPALLDELVARRQLTRSFADTMATSPGSFTARNASFIAQNTYDLVGNAAAGDDEYRLGNEVAHKTAQYLVEARFGRQPDVLRWGLGYVAEQRLFASVYQFLPSGFVDAEDHFGWPEKTRAALTSVAKKDFSITDTILRGELAGTMALGQRCAWATLDYQLAKEPAKLAALLTQLGALDREADPDAKSLAYLGDKERVRTACEAAWGKFKVSTLTSHLKRFE